MPEKSVRSATVSRRIEYSDLDPSGRYHYSTSIRLFEAAETELLSKLGLLDEIYNSMPRARISFEFRKPLFFRDEVEATVEVAALGRTSITFGFKAVCDGELCVEGDLVAVLLDEDFRPTPFSDEQRAILDPASD